MANKKDNLHKGKFVGGYVGDEQFAKVERIENYLASIFGEADVNRSKVLRYIIDNFDEEMLPRLPKNAAPIDPSKTTLEPQGMMA